MDAKPKANANQFFYFPNQLSYLRRSAISLICDPILYSFILSVVPVSLSLSLAWYLTKRTLQPSLYFLNLLSIFQRVTLDPIEWKISRAGNVSLDIGDRKSQSTTPSPCHTACVLCGAEGILNYTAAILKPRNHFQS